MFLSGEAAQLVFSKMSEVYMRVTSDAHYMQEKYIARALQYQLMVGMARDIDASGYLLKSFKKKSFNELFLSIVFFAVL